MHRHEGAGNYSHNGLFCGLCCGGDSVPYRGSLELWDREQVGGSGQLNNPSGIRLGPGGQGTLWPRMADIVNLRTARKRVNRRRDEERAAKARVAHGMSKADRALAETARPKFLRKLAEHRIETGDSDEIAGR